MFLLTSVILDRRFQLREQGSGSENGKCCVDPVTAGGKLRRWVSDDRSLPTVASKHGKTAPPFKSGGAKRSDGKAKWLVHKEAVEREVLTLPAQQQVGSTKKRKTVDVAGRLLTREQLHAMSELQKKRSRLLPVRSAKGSVVV